MKSTTLQFYKERLLRVLIQIQQRLDEPLSLEELARQACLSRITPPFNSSNLRL